MSRDTGIRNLIPGYRDPDEIKEDQNTRRYIETIVNQRAPVANVEPFGTTLVRTTPSLNLGLKPRDVTKEPKSFISEKEYQNHLIKSPSKLDHEKQKDEAVMLPVGLGNKYKSDIRSPVEKKRDSYNAKVAANKARIETNKAKADPTKGAHYTPWYERMAAEEAEALNKIKRSTWEQGGRVKPEPKYVNAQDVQKVYEPEQPEATPLQMKNLHKRLENHNEMTGQFKHIPKEEKPTHTPRFLHNPSTNELEDTYDPNWGDDILNEKK